MPNDAKIGLAVGVGLVIVAAFLFKGNSSPETPSSPPANNSPAIPSPHMVPPPPPRQEGSRHTVRDGETLTELARRYYGDRSLSMRIFDSNRDRLLSPDRLPPGTELIIPDLDRTASGSRGEVAKRNGRPGQMDKGVVARATSSVASR